MQLTRKAFLATALLLSVAATAHGAGSKEAKKREALLQSLEEARAKALEAIFDTQTYRNEDHGRSGQALVDERVERVRAAFALVNPLLQQDVGRVLKAPAAKRQAFVEANAQDLTPWERAVQRRIADIEVERRNEALSRPPKEGLPPSGELPADAEREQARHTNEYRMLMGRPALLIDTRLVASARAHSKEMRRLRYFDHDSPVAENRTPSDRCRKVGVKDVAIGENICDGYSSAQEAFNGWYHSAGHHRNTLEPDWRSIGVGRDGELWTQNYAGRAADVKE